jgi:TonB family protein
MGDVVSTRRAQVAAAKLRNEKLLVAPSPILPPEARKQNITGSGQFRINFDDYGNAKSVEIVRSTGSGILDADAVKTLKHWRVFSGVKSKIVPVTY